MLARCSLNTEHKRFATTVIEKHDCIVDDKGEMIEETGCVDVIQGPDSDNIWTCKECGAEAIVED